MIFILDLHAESDSNQSGESALEQGITDIYQRVLHRPPDTEGLETWKSHALKDGYSLEKIEEKIKKSGEAKMKNGRGEDLESPVPQPSYSDPFGYNQLNNLGK